MEEQNKNLRKIPPIERKMSVTSALPRIKKGKNMNEIDRRFNWFQ